jgi:outer membrane murein-binding lipoprotein Lpp
MVMQRRSRVFFTIDTDNEIVAHETAPAALGGVVVFSTEKELAKAAAEWPMGRLVDTWNGFAGVAGTFGDLKPVKKFMDRPSATKRIWAAIQRLAEDVRRASAAKPAAREGTAKANVLAMIQRPGGATLDEIRAATGWQPHTVRGSSAWSRSGPA